MDAHDIVMHIKDNDCPAVLASLVGVEGHSYRKEGAVMLFFEGGVIGSLSPGCLESDLQLRTEELWASGKPETVEYDMLSPDDFAWGEAVGCGGKIKVVLEPVKGELREALVAAHDRMEEGESLILSRKIAPQGYSYTLECTPVEGQAAARMHSDIFSTLLEPKPRLVIFGGGLDAAPIAALAVRVGFRIVVADWREGSLRNEFPGAERLICPPGEAVDRLSIGSNDYVLICSHQSQRDREFLEKLISAKPKYIGIIGSAARINLLMEGLPIPQALHAPVGIAIGGEGPEEIAVSIVAEMIQIRRTAQDKLPKGVECIENSRYLSGSRSKQTDGRIQGISEAVSGNFIGERRAQ